MSHEIKTIEVNARWRRILLLLPIVAVVLGTWHVGRWFVGDTMAQWIPEDAEAAHVTAAMAARLAPDDPQTHYTLAELGMRSFEPAELPEALRQYELATSLSPFDYRLWLSLGRARALAGDAAGSEQALRRVVELAPAYAEPRWLLGNYLLREGRTDEAFAELRRASEADPQTYQAQVFDLAWHIFKEDPRASLAAVGDTPAARAAFADYLLQQKRMDDAIKLWNSLDAKQQGEQRAVGDNLLHALMSAKRFHAALEVARSTGAGEAAQPELNRLLNGDFESNVEVTGKNLFGWQVVPVAQTQINFDARQRHSGARSLRIVFEVASTIDFRNVSQFIVVEPQTRYRLTHYVRTEDLKSTSTPLTEVADAANPQQVLAASSPLPLGTSDWQLVTLDFTTATQTEGIIVRISRQCATPVCPLYGKVWYDDFDLQRTGGGSNNNNTRRDAR